jgi:DHA1 family tetracycline resistance protein-like MFS transporter
MNNRRLLTIFIIVFVDLLGFSLILPLLPYYAENFGASPFVVGLLVAAYAGASLIGSPVLGRLSDRIGRRPVLLVSVLGTLMGFLLLAFAAPIGRSLAGWLLPGAENAMVLGVLFIARILDGVTAGNLTVAQAYIADVTDESNRARGLGLIGAAFGLGFIIGPAVGGLLSKVSFSLPALVAAGIAGLNLVQIYFVLPETLTNERRREMGEIQRPRFTLGALVTALKRPVIGPLLSVRFFFSLAFATFQSIFALYAQYRLGLGADQTGYILAYVGILSVIVQGGLIGPLSKNYTEKQLVITGLWLMTGSLLAWAWVPNLAVLLVIMLPLAMAGGVLGTVLQSMISKAVKAEEIGGMLGISGSLEALTRVIAPTVGGLLIQRLGTWAPGIFSGAVMAVAVWLAYRRIILVKEKAIGLPVEVADD